MARPAKSVVGGDEPGTWLQIAKDAFANSTTFVDANYRKNWENALLSFQGRHGRDSKYNSDTYRHRSRLYRPKTRSVIRKNEAAAAIAFFSNNDVIGTDAVDPNNPKQVASAAVMKELIQYRLTKTIKWFQLLMGAIQDAQTIGVCASTQYWEYSERKTSRQQPIVDEMGQASMDENGNPAQHTIEEVEVLSDKPVIKLIPIENLRIDRGADWEDPINSSPFLIHLVPYYVVDLKAMMNTVDSKTGRPKWKSLGDDAIRSSTKHRYDSTRVARENERQDGKETDNPISDYDIAWVHVNYVRRNGKEWVYWTLGVDEMLTDPVPLKEVIFHGQRPFAMGCFVLETHKIYPAGVPDLSAGLQREANDLANQRMDNIKFVLNKRWIAKRGSQVDVRSLVRNVPGSVTLANDPEKDVREVNFPDITASAYQEQDRINLDFDELVGNFSSGSVQSNRRLNETVGGMAILAQGSNQLTEYGLRTFKETWVQPVLRQLVKLEQYYETDEVVLAIAGERAQLMQRFNIDHVTDDLLMQELTLNVNVGMGATDPVAKLQRLLQGVQAYQQVALQPAPGLNVQEIGKEIFGFLGYQDGKRFIEDGQQQEDPRMAQMQQAMQEMQQKLDNKALDHDAKVKVAAIHADATTKTAELQADTEKRIALHTNDTNKQIAASEHGIKRDALLRDHAQHQDQIALGLLDAKVKHAIGMKPPPNGSGQSTSH